MYTRNGMFILSIIARSTESYDRVARVLQTYWNYSRIQKSSSFNIQTRHLSLPYPLSSFPAGLENSNWLRSDKHYSNISESVEAWAVYAIPSTHSISDDWSVRALGDSNDAYHSEILISGISGKI